MANGDGGALRSQNSSADVDLIVNVSLPDTVRKNGSLYAHVYLVRSGKSPNPSKHDQAGRAPYHSYPDLVVTSVPLTKYMKKIARNRTSLLGGDTEGGEGGKAEGGNSSAVAEQDTEPEVSNKNVQPFLASIFVFGVTSLIEPSIYTAVLR